MSNVKAICAAIQMYMDDHGGRLPPAESRSEAKDYFTESPGRKSLAGAWAIECPRVTEANPYLRWPVVLEGYLDTRERWRCPSALLEQGAAFINGSRDWLKHLQENAHIWGVGAGKLCIQRSFPAGWGGEVTDSIVQGRLAGVGRATAAAQPAGVFLQSIAVNTSAAGLRRRQIGDPAWFVICADGGGQVDDIGTGTLAYPDICSLECANEACGWVDWEECTWAADCGLYDHAPQDGSFLRNPELRKPFSRHRGGVNIGFLDGHAAWFDSEEVIRESPSKGNPARGALRGYAPWGPTSDCDFAEENPGVPTLY